MNKTRYISRGELIERLIHMRDYYREKRVEYMNSKELRAALTYSICARDLTNLINKCKRMT